MIDFVEANKLLCFLGNEHIFQTFSEGAYKARNITNKKDAAARQLSSDTYNYEQKLDKLQAVGAGVFFQANAGTKRGAKYVSGIRACVLDLDGPPLTGLQAAVKRGYPQPHCVVESSKGRYHSYWKVFDCPVDRFGAVQKLIALQFDGDTTVVNPDRVFRLPGSVNYKYNDQFRARIIHFKPELPLVSIADLMDTPLVDDQVAPVSDALTEALITAPDDEDYSILAAGNRTNKLIKIAGRLVDDDTTSTVESVMDELRRLAEKHRPEGDPPVDESAWATEIEPGVRRFIERRDAELRELDRESSALLESQGSDATDFTDAIGTDVLGVKDFAERFIFVSTLRLVYDLERSPASEPWGISAFRDYASVYKKKGKQIAGIWLSNQRYRRTVHSTTYLPYAHNSSEEARRVRRVVRDTTTGDLCYNTYAPPPTLPVTKDAFDAGKVGIFLDHIDYLFPDRDVQEKFLDWWAATIQYPQRRITWAPLIISSHQGVGKGWMAQVLRTIAGPSNFRMITQDNLDGNAAQYNDFLANSTVVVVDELKARRRSDIVNRLNAMITDQSIEVNTKFGKKGMQQIYANFICYSNHTDAVAITAADRRYWVHILAQRPRTTDYYVALWHWLETDGPAHLLRFLLDRDISKFEFGGVPEMTEDKSIVIEGNWTEIESLLNSATNEKVGPFRADVLYQDVVVEWVQRELNLVLEKPEKLEIKTWLRTAGLSLGARSGSGTRQVIYAIRYKEHWKSAPPSRVIKECQKCADYMNSYKLKRVK